MEMTSLPIVTPANAFGRVSSRADKYAIAKQIWPDSGLTLHSFPEEVYEGYLNYIERVFQLVEHNYARFAVQTLAGTVELIDTLRSQSDQPLSTIIQTVAPHFMNCGQNEIQRSLELAARIWLTVNVSSRLLDLGPISPLEDSIVWNDDTSLDSLIERQFAEPKIYPPWENSTKIEGTFTATYLVGVCGFRIRWVDTLNDHLKLDLSTHVLSVYKHKICLMNHLKSSSRCPIPSTVLEEAMDTLNLLFPFGDVATQRLLSKENEIASYRLGSAGRIRESDLSKYPVWRERLEELLMISRNPPLALWKELATGYKQLADSRKNSLMEWSAFWVTIVAFVTLITVPCSIIQTTYAMKAYYEAKG